MAHQWDHVTGDENREQNEPHEVGSSTYVELTRSNRPPTSDHQQNEYKQTTTERLYELAGELHKVETATVVGKDEIVNEREQAADELDAHVDGEQRVEIVKMSAQTVENKRQDEEIDGERVDVDLDDVVDFVAELMLESVVVLGARQTVDEPNVVVDRVAGQATRRWPGCGCCCSRGSCRGGRRVR